MTTRNRSFEFQSRAEVLIVIVLALVSLLVSISCAMAMTFKVREGTNVNARSGPGIDYAKFDVLSSGTLVEEIERNGDWSRVRLDDSRLVWMHSRFLENANAAYFVREGIKLNARQGPGTDFAIEVTLQPKTRVEELERHGDWSWVRLDDGQQVWINNSFIRQDEPTEDRRHPIAITCSRR